MKSSYVRLSIVTDAYLSATDTSHCGHSFAPTMRLLSCRTSWKNLDGPTSEKGSALKSVFATRFYIEEGRARERLT